VTKTPRLADEIRDGCGWTNAVSISSVGGAEFGAAQITCELAAALALWVKYELQPLAVATFGSRNHFHFDRGVFTKCE